MATFPKNKEFVKKAIKNKMRLPCIPADHIRPTKNNMTVPLKNKKSSFVSISRHRTKINSNICRAKKTDIIFSVSGGGNVPDIEKIPLIKRTSSGKMEKTVPVSQAYIFFKGNSRASIPSIENAPRHKNRLSRQRKQTPEKNRIDKII